MADLNPPFRPTMVRARALGRALLQIYDAHDESTPAELLELLDIAEARLEKAGYHVGAGGESPADTSANESNRSQ